MYFDILSLVACVMLRVWYEGCLRAKVRERRLEAAVKDILFAISLYTGDRAFMNFRLLQYAIASIIPAAD